MIVVGDLLTLWLCFLPWHQGQKRGQVRRRPKQRRARETVEAVLDAVIRILKRDGYRAITTNRIADVAGVSIGSVYQYFPDKASIFNALHQRHVDQIDRMVQSKLVEHASSALEDLMRAMIEAMVDAHATDPELYELLLTEVPHKADGTKEFAVRLHGAFRLRSHQVPRLKTPSRSRHVLHRAELDEALPWRGTPPAPGAVTQGCERRSRKGSPFLSARVKQVPNESASLRKFIAPGPDQRIVSPGSHIQRLVAISTPQRSPMKYNTLGPTGLLVSEICLGTMTFAAGEGMWKSISGVDQTLPTKSSSSPSMPA